MSIPLPFCLTCGHPLVSTRVQHCSTRCYRQAITDSRAGDQFWAGIRAMTARGNAGEQGRSFIPPITSGRRKDLLWRAGR